MLASKYGSYLEKLLKNNDIDFHQNFCRITLLTGQRSLGKYGRTVNEQDDNATSSRFCTSFTKWTRRLFRVEGILLHVGDLLTRILQKINLKIKKSRSSRDFPVSLHVYHTFICITRIEIVL